MKMSSEQVASQMLRLKRDWELASNTEQDEIERTWSKEEGQAEDSFVAD